MSLIDECGDIAVINQKEIAPSGLLIFLHGAGITGKDQKEEFQKLLKDNCAFPHIKIVFPSSPVKYFNFFQKEHKVWFDVKWKSNEIVIDYEDVKRACNGIENIINQELRNGIPKERIVIGGWSQGGMVAMYSAYTSMPYIAGVAVTSACFPFDKADILEPPLPPLFQCHYIKDGFIPLKRARMGFDYLCSKGVRGELKLFDGNVHCMTENSLNAMYKWILDRIPHTDCI